MFYLLCTLDSLHREIVQQSRGLFESCRLSVQEQIFCVHVLYVVVHKSTVFIVVDYFFGETVSSTFGNFKPPPLSLLEDEDNLDFLKV